MSERLFDYFAERYSLCLTEEQLEDIREAVLDELRPEYLDDTLKLAEEISPRTPLVWSMVSALKIFSGEIPDELT